MTQITSTESNTFKLTDMMDESIYVIIKYTKTTKLYEDGRTYFYIDYKNIESSSGKKINSAHPFFYEKKYRMHVKGDIIFKNPMTTHLTNMMLLNDENLEKYSGTVTGQCYRKSLMKTIAILFD